MVSLSLKSRISVGTLGPWDYEKLSIIHLLSGDSVINFHQYEEFCLANGLN